MKIKQVKLDDLVPYIKNSRTHSSEQVEQIAASITEFGFNNPILIDGDNGIIAGHGRLLAAKQLKLKTIPTIDLSHLSKEQKKAYIIADNKLALNAGWDDNVLISELNELQDSDFDISLIGFSLDELAALLGDDDGEDDYTKNVKSPIYEVTGDKPSIEELYNTAKYDQLILDIDAADIPDEEKAFLRIAATRHIVFNYEAAAEYYAHVEQPTQELMEDSALIIIDFKKAIELGFVKLSEDMAEVYLDDDQ